jgi:xanthine dehydrogenase accessory factor
MGLLIDTARHWIAQRQAAVVVRITEARGSVPRDAGTRMLVAADQVAGTIGGGHVELKAIEQAREMLASRTIEPRSTHYALGPSLGQCCGGALTLAFEPLADEALADWIDEAPRSHLQLYGAGHVGRAVARLLATLNVSVDWIDEREMEFPPALREGPWPSHIRKVVVDAVEGEVKLAPPGAFYLVMTHNHDLDQRVTEAVLRRGDFGFLGLIGSRSKQQRFVHRLLDRGIPEATVARMVCPIGLDGVEGKEPEVIAVGVVAQLLQKSGHNGP